MNQDPNAVGVNQINKSQGAAIKTEFFKYLKYWYWFALAMILAFLAGYAYLRYTPKIYVSEAKIKILNKSKGLELPSSAFVFNRSSINLENETEILKSYRIIESVVRELNLTMEFYEEGNVLTSEILTFPFKFTKIVHNDSITSFQEFSIAIEKDGFHVTQAGSPHTEVFANHNSYNVKHKFPFEIQIENKSLLKDLLGKKYILRLRPVSAATRSLKGKIEITTLGKESDLLKLNYKNESKSRASVILNTLIDVFDKDGISDRQEVSRRTIEFIDERFLSLANELDSIEVDIKDFKRSNNFINIESDAEVGISQKTISESRVFDVENQLIISNLLEKDLKTSGSDLGLLPANIGIDDANINGLISQYNELVLQRDKLSVSGGENNPTIQILEDKIENVQNNIDASIDSYKAQLQASKKQLINRNQKYASQVSSLPLKEKLLRSRVRQQEIKQTLYLFLLQKREEAAINLAITEPTIKVVEYALANNAPVSPNSKNVYLICLVIGLFLPFGVIYGLNFLNTKIKDKSDVVNSVGNIPILAELPKIKSGKLVFDNPTDRSVQSEAFRILSANVNYILPPNDDGKGKVVFCTSTIKGEGKTYVGMNLSLALSSINKKVLLIGADLRNPQIHTYVEKDKNESGLSNFLHDETIDWKNSLIKGFSKHPNHDILLSGSIPPNPTQLLTNGRFEQLINEAKNLYDYVIVDTAPTILVTDTLLISKLADATIYLVRADYTEKNLLEFSKNLNNSGKLKNMAYVLNGVGASRAYGYSYNYGYGYGYGSPE